MSPSPSTSAVSTDLDQTSAITCRFWLNFNQVAMEGTGFTHVGEPLTGQLVSTAAGRKAGPVEALGHYKSYLDLGGEDPQDYVKQRIKTLEK